MIFAPMNCITKLALISTAALLASCGTKTEAAPMAPTPAGVTPTTTPVAPANNIPQAPHQAPAVTPTPAPVATPPAAPTMADLGTILGGITDGPTATAAKSKLEAVIASVKSAASAATSGQLGADLSKLAGTAAAKAGVDMAGLKAAALKQVEGLLSNPAIKSAIGPTLEQLVPLLK